MINRRIRKQFKIKLRYLHSFKNKCFLRDLFNICHIIFIRHFYDLTQIGRHRGEMKV